MGRAWRAWGVAAASGVLAQGGCLANTTTPPLGEVLVVADTDLGVPRMVGRLRVDLYTTDGTWYGSRDLTLPHPSDWPASFAVQLADGQPATDVVLRLRAYAEAKVRDYLGERFSDRPATCDDGTCAGASPSSCCALRVPDGVAPTSGPRLLDSARADVTPPTEPLPGTTVDRLVLLHLAPDVAASTTLMLAGACEGTMADLRDFTNLATCVDTEHVRGAVPAAALGSATPVSTSSAQGTFDAAHAADCSTPPRPAGSWNGTALHDDEVCLPGGSFVMGSRDTAIGDPRDALPERASIVSSFLIDRYEVTVARFRKALAEGFPDGVPAANDGPMGDRSVPPNSPTLCTWSDSPVGREDYPVNCLTRLTAAAFCRSAGGDLPTEAQWEYAAGAAGRAAKTRYPWGPGGALAPSCTDVVYGRIAGIVPAGVTGCTGWGPSPVTTAEHAGGDVTPGPGAGVVDLGGNVAEWTIDTFAAFDSNCWLAAPLLDPACTAAASTTAVGDVPAAAHTTRGAYWGSLPKALFVADRDAAAQTGRDTGVGFRCVRPGGG